MQENHSQFHYVMKQGIWTLIGFGAMFVMMRFDYQLLNRAWIVYGLLLRHNRLAACGVRFSARQRSAALDQVAAAFRCSRPKLAKLSLAIFVAYFIQRRAGEEQSFWKTFLPCMFVLGIVAALVVKEPDLGNGADARDHRVHDVLCGRRAAAAHADTRRCRRCCSLARC